MTARPSTPRHFTTKIPKTILQRNFGVNLHALFGKLDHFRASGFFFKYGVSYLTKRVSKFTPKSLYWVGFGFTTPYFLCKLQKPR